MIIWDGTDLVAFGIYGLVIAFLVIGSLFIAARDRVKSAWRKFRKKAKKW